MTRLTRGTRSLAAVALAVLAGGALANNTFCAGATAPATPADLEHGVSDLSLQHVAQQPASMVTCAMGYMLEKCGDHATANAVFDKCIAAGYVSAMIWKALLYEDGAGVAQDSAKAAALLRRAAEAGDPAYSPLAKLHYASALYQGRGVARDEAQALRLFREAAAAGNAEAREFLLTGYHVGQRDQQARGMGQPPSSALAALAAPQTATPAPADPLDDPRPDAFPPLPPALAQAVSGAVRQLEAPAQSAAVSAGPREVQGLSLRPTPPRPQWAVPAHMWLLVAPVALFLAGLAQQARRESRSAI